MSGGKTLLDVRTRLLEEVEELKRKRAAKKKPNGDRVDISVMMVAKRCLPKELINEEDLEGVSHAAFALTHLFLDRMRITAIDNLECFNKITHLNLQHNRITKIEGLEFAPMLEVMVLHHNQIQKVENLSHLKNLKQLDLSHNQIASFEPESLPAGLENLSLASNPLTLPDTKTLTLTLVKLLTLNGRHLAGDDEGGGGGGGVDVVDETVWADLAKANEARVAAYWKAKREEEGEGANEEAVSKDPVPGIDKSKLMQLWELGDVAEFKSSLATELGNYSSDSVRQRILDKSKQRRDEHERERQATLARASRAIMVEARRKLEEAKKVESRK